MKRIIHVAVVAIACSAGAAWSQQSDEQVAQASQSGQAAASVAQASPGAERPAISREETQSRKISLHDMGGLAGDGVFPSRGGPLDD